MNIFETSYMANKQLSEKIESRKSVNKSCNHGKSSNSGKPKSKKITNERFKRDYTERTKYLLADMNDEKKFADDLIEFMGGIDALDFEIEDGHLVAKIPVADSVFSIDFNTDDATALTNMEYPDYMDLFIDISVQDFGDPIDTYDALHDTFDLSDYGINEDDEDDEDDDFDEDDESYI